MSKERSYIAIDLKSFYASVECVERGLDPLTTNLVVADASRTNKTICLAVSPSLKSYGIPGRARLFEVVRVAGQQKLDYITAPPRMALYIDYSAKIYETYLKYIAPEDIYSYSIDEVFIDATDYLNVYNVTPHQLAKKLIKHVYKETGITATAGIGTNLYLCKIAMDIVAKHIEADEDGVRIAQLDEMSYRRKLWNHRPITDFWRVGRGYARKLEQNGIYTMGDVARCSIGKDDEYYNEDLLYNLFGINAELLIDHAWGYEPCTLEQIKAYRPENNSLSSGQVLSCPYECDKAKIVVMEMADMLALDLVDKELLTDQLVLTIQYDTENLTNPEYAGKYRGAITIDSYGRKVPKHAHGTITLDKHTSSTRKIMEAVSGLYDRIINKNLLIRKINLVANHVTDEKNYNAKPQFEQMNLFTDYNVSDKEKEVEQNELKKEKQIQKAMLSIKKKYGKNAVLRGMNFEEGATAKDRNNQIGGHKA